MKPPLTLFQCRAPSVASMSGRYSALATLALAGALGLAAPALSQDVSAPCRLCDSKEETPQEKPAAPVQLDVEASLDFDRLILAGSGHGTAQLSPDGSSRTSGTVAAIGAGTMVGEVVIRGEPGRHVRVSLPSRVELHGLAGGTIQLDSIRSDLPSMPRLDSNGVLRFRFGGAVRVSGDADGEFRGDVPVDVDYL